MSKDKSRLGLAEFSQPCTTAIQIALVNTLRSWKILPSIVIGHSSGEIAAAYASGALTAAAAIRVAYYRGLATTQSEFRNTHKGAMAAIGLGHDDVLSLLREGVVVACQNSPSSVTLSGDETALFEVIADIKKLYPDILVRPLRVDCAYHSHHMKAIASDYLTMLDDLKPTLPEIPFYSTVVGRCLDSSTPLNAAYWAENLSSSVLFSPAVTRILQERAPQLFLEIGPHSALAGPLREISRSRGINAADYKYTPTLVRNVDAVASMLNTVGYLFQEGFNIDFSNIVPVGRVLADLPVYPWQRSGNFRDESRVVAEWRLREYPHHDLLGSRISLTSNSTPTWRNLLNVSDVPWVAEHRVNQEIVFPAAGYLSMAGEAIRQLTGGLHFSARAVNFVSPLLIHEGEDTELITVLKPVRLTNTTYSEWYEFEISSVRKGIWIRHVFGQGRKDVALSDDATLAHPDPGLRVTDGASWYSAIDRVQLSYGTRFRGLKNIRADVIRHRAVADIRNDIAISDSHYCQHPCTLDFVLQLAYVANCKGLPRLMTTLAVPSYIEEVSVRALPHGAHIAIEATTDPCGTRGAYSADILGISSGKAAIKMKGLRISPLGGLDSTTGDNPHGAAELVWKPDIYLIDLAKLIRTKKDFHASNILLNRLALACTIESYALLKGLSPASKFMCKFQTMLRERRDQAENGYSSTLPDAKDITAMSSPERTDLIEKLHGEANKADCWASAAAIRRVYESCRGIFTGEVDVLSILLEDDVLSRIYNEMMMTDYSDFFTLAAHYKPNLKILEIGAGTGGTTNTILPLLKNKQNDRMYYSYTFTDISPGFFNAAKDRFNEFPGIEYKVLDVEKDPVQQGFSEHSFDIIVAANVSFVEFCQVMRTYLMA